MQTLQVNKDSFIYSFYYNLQLCFAHKKTIKSIWKPPQVRHSNNRQEYFRKYFKLSQYKCYYFCLPVHSDSSVLSTNCNKNYKNKPQIYRGQEFVIITLLYY